MATAYVSFGVGGGRSPSGPVPVLADNPTSTEVISTSASSAQSVGSATVDGIVRVNCDTALYATVGANPTASATTGWFIPTSETTEIAIASGEKIALIDA